MKNTAKPVTEVKFPAVTICAAGFHMSNVEKKIGLNFQRWRNETGRTSNNEGEIRKDMEEYMRATFQIEPPKGGQKPPNILDILDTMVASNQEDSGTANSVRKNVNACSRSETEISSPKREKRSTGEPCIAAAISLHIEGLIDIEDMNFESSNDSSLSVTYQQKEWVGEYQLETISEGIDGSVRVYKKRYGVERYVYFSNRNFESRCRPGDHWGCREENDRQVAQVPFFNGTMYDGDFCTPTVLDISYDYNRWFGRAGNGGDGKLLGEGDKRGYGSSKQYPTPKLSIEILKLTTTIEESVVADSLQSICIKTSQNTSSNASSSPADLPGIDIFLNPNRTDEKEFIADTKQKIAKDYFNESNMATLYPELFDILWESTLPCFKNEEEVNDAMLLSCQLGGKNVNCSSLFKRVPTDTGMCCALNNVDSLRDSEYKHLVHKHQGETMTQTVNSTVGRRNGLRLTLDLHSNMVSFGTLGLEYDAFNVFIGQHEEFPMMLEKSLQLQPGREHFIDLSARVVSTNDIKDIAPEARECYFNDEGDLEFYEKYTYSNCRLECAIKRSEGIHRCVPWHLPRVKKLTLLQLFLTIATIIQAKDSKTCDPWTAWEFTNHLEEETDCPHCLADCELTTYSTTITSSEFRCGKIVQNQIILPLQSRLCDSRNLNLSPFCNLTSSSLVKWQPAVNKTYAGKYDRNYISGLKGPMRLKYPPNKAQEELLSSLTKVNHSY